MSDAAVVGHSGGVGIARHSVDSWLTLLYVVFVL